MGWVSTLNIVESLPMPVLGTKARSLLEKPPSEAEV